MIVLAIEISTPDGSVAVVSGTDIVSVRLDSSPLRGVSLIDGIDEALREACCGLDDIELFAVGAGPGSFTGTRIGVATAKSFAFALKKPIVRVNSLHAIAANLPQADGAIAVVTDARRKAVYLGLFATEGENVKVLSEVKVLPAQEAPDQVPAGSRVVGDALETYPELFSGDDYIRVEDAALKAPRAESVARLGLSKYRESGGDDVFRLIPYYLRVTEAEEKWDIDAARTE